MIQPTPPPWRVLLIGGASGVGKTSVSYRVAQHYSAGLTEVDDFQVVLERVTTPEQYPALHAFRLDPAAWLRQDEHAKLAAIIACGREMRIVLELVIANHVANGPPLVLEGDFILPELAMQPAYDGVRAGGLVLAVFIHEPEEAQIARNYLVREGEAQPERARVSWRYSEWLRAEAQRLGVPAVPARPWDTLFERVLAVLSEG